MTAFFSVSGLAPMGPAAQTASTGANGRIVYVGSDGVNNDILTMNADGTGVVQLTNDGDHNANPEWSPDGTRIAFDSTRSGNREVWVVNADGGGLVNVSDHPGQDYEPAWSPDGAQITFTSGRAGELDVWAVDAPPPSPTSAASTSALEVGADTALAASTPRNLTRGSNTDAKSPNWAPNTAPTITHLRPAKDSLSTDLGPVIGAKVTDMQTYLTKSNTALFLDGTKVPRANYTYTRDTDRMRYAPETDLRPGAHTVKVVARDPEGLIERKTWNFDLARP